MFYNTLITNMLNFSVFISTIKLFSVINHLIILVGTHLILLKAKNKKLSELQKPNFFLHTSSSI